MEFLESFIPAPPHYERVKSNSLWLDLLGNPQPNVVSVLDAKSGDACLIRGGEAVILKIESVLSRKKQDGKIILVEKKIIHYFQLEENENEEKFVTLYSSFLETI